jgi:hypothetical protein
MENFIYRDYVIDYRAKPVPSRSMDWEWTSPHYDGNEFDDGVGFASSREAAMAAVDFDILENWGKRA